MSATDRLAQAEETLRRAEAHRRKLLQIKTAEQEIPSLWDTNQVTMARLAKDYGISPMTVRRILVDNGRAVHRFRKLTHEEKAEVVGLLKRGESPEHLAEVYQCSKATIRRVGLEAGALRKGQRKPRRSDAEYALILAFDEEARARFNGAGLYNLGLGLRAWQLKKRGEAEAERKAEAGAGPEDMGDWNVPEEDETPSTVPARPEPSEWTPDPSVKQWAPNPTSPPPSEVPTVIGDGDPNEDAPAVVGPHAPGGTSY